METRRIPARRTTRHLQADVDLHFASATPLKCGVSWRGERMEVIHLDFQPTTVAWIGSLQSRLHQSSSSELQRRYSRWEEVGLGELALAVATRLAICIRVQQNLCQSLENLRREAEAWDKLDEGVEGPFCFRPRDLRQLFDICAAVDALFFEFRSVYEVLKKFATKFSRRILGKQFSEAELLKALQARGNTEWVELIRENRNLFFHQTAPWIALQVHQRRPLSCSLLVMKENIKQFDDPSKYITEAQLAAAVEGVQEAAPAVRSWLERQLFEVEAELASAS